MNLNSGSNKGTQVKKRKGSKFKATFLNSHYLDVFSQNNQNHIYLDDLTSMQKMQLPFLL